LSRRALRAYWSTRRAYKRIGSVSVAKEV